jgi:hypothetical protein
MEHNSKQEYFDGKGIEMTLTVRLFAKIQTPPLRQLMERSAVKIYKVSHQE